jgi:hypothetical protein
LDPGDVSHVCTSLVTSIDTHWLAAVTATLPIRLPLAGGVFQLTLFSPQEAVTSYASIAPPVVTLLM